MPMLDGVADTAPAPTPAAAAPAPAPAADVSVVPAADPTAGAAEVFYDGKSSQMVDDLKAEEPKPADPVEAPKADEKPAETEEEKAAREAAETPEQKAAREAEEKKAAEKAAGAPEAYADFTLPEGVTIDKDVDAAFRSTAKELNLTQEQAQSLINLQVQANEKATASAQQAMKDQQTEWQNAFNSDKEFGGDKAKASLSLANKAVSQFGDPDLKALLAGPLGDHPALVRFAARVGKAVSEAPVITGAPAAAADAASVLYPTMNK